MSKIDQAKARLDKVRAIRALRLRQLSEAEVSVTEATDAYMQAILSEEEV